MSEQHHVTPEEWAQHPASDLVLAYAMGVGGALRVLLMYGEINALMADQVREVIVEEVMEMFDYEDEAVGVFARALLAEYIKRKEVKP